MQRLDDIVPVGFLTRKVSTKKSTEVWAFVPCHQPRDSLIGPQGSVQHYYTSPRTAHAGLRCVRSVHYSTSPTQGLSPGQPWPGARLQQTRAAHGTRSLWRFVCSYEVCIMLACHLTSAPISHSVMSYHVIYILVFKLAIVLSISLPLLIKF